eukprot:1161579-Pelagomonas_calceolata.AAC.8
MGPFTFSHPFRGASTPMMNEACEPHVCEHLRVSRSLRVAKTLTSMALRLDSLRAPCTRYEAGQLCQVGKL